LHTLHNTNISQQLGLNRNIEGDPAPKLLSARSVTWRRSVVLHCAVAVEKGGGGGGRGQRREEKRREERS
jgi:hypothetical protein